MMNMATDTTQNLTEFSLTTCPATVRHFEVTENDGHTALLTWEPLEIAPTQYIIEWWETERPETIQRKVLLCTKHTIHLKGSDISIRVAAENEAGRSYTDTIQLPAAPKAPENIKIVQNDATPGALLVQYSDPDASHKTYYVTATNVADKTDHVKESTAGRNIIIASLKTGTLYEVEVHSESKGLLSLPVWHSNPVLTIPDKVEAISTTKISQYTWQAKWEEVHGAESYDVHWRRVYDSNYKIVKSTANDITLPNLDSDTVYEIRIAAQNASGQGPLSDPESFKTDIPLSLPKSVKVLPNTNDPATTLKVWFDEPQHKPESYTVMARTGGKFVTKQHVNENSLIVGGLEPGTEYTIYVHCGGGVTKLSDMASSAPVWTSPGRVTDVHASKRSATSYHVSWAKLPGATEYEIQYQANEKSKIVSQNNALLDRLSYYTKYKVQVRGKNTGGEGKFSDGHEFTTSLGPPTNIEVRNNPDYPDTAINVNFKEPTPRAPFYKLVARGTQRGVDDVETQTIRDGGVIEGLPPGVAYTVSVCSVKKDGASLTSEEIKSKEILTCPGTTTNIEAVPLSQNSYKFKWTPVSGSATYDIKIRKKEGGLEKTKGSKDHCMIFDDLDLNQEYTVRIIAKNAAGSGKDSEEKHFRTAFGPPAEVTVSGNDEKPQISVVVKFTKPVPEADKYMVRLKNMSSKEPDIEEITEESITTMSGLEEGETYQVFVRSMSGASKLLNSAETEPVSITTALREMPKPACCAVSDGWKMSWDPIPKARSYIVAWRIENNAWTEEATKHEEHILRGMEPGKTYECRVYTASDANRRAGSKVAKFTAAPTTPAQLTYKILSPSEVLLKCDKCEGATSYEFTITSTDGTHYPITISNHSPECKLEEPFFNMGVTVVARNKGGNSSVSEQLKFRQEFQEPQYYGAAEQKSTPRDTDVSFSVTRKTENLSEQHLGLHATTQRGTSSELALIPESEESDADARTTITTATETEPCKSRPKVKASYEEKANNRNSESTGDQAVKKAPPRGLKKESRNQVGLVLRETCKHKARKDKFIGPKGGSIELYDCEIELPPGAPDRNTSVQISVDNNPENFPKSALAISPILGCKPDLFSASARVTMPTWYCAKVGQEIPAMVLSRNQADSDWKRVMDIKLKNEYEVQFEVPHFCEKVIAVSKENASTGLCRLKNSVLVQKDTGEVFSIFFWDKKSQEECSQQLEVRNNFMHVWPKDLAIYAEAGNKVAIEVECIKPTSILIEPYRGKKPVFTLTQSFLNLREEPFFNFDFVPELGESEYKGKLNIHYAANVLSDSPEEILRPSSRKITFNWPCETQPLMNVTTKSIGMNVEGGQAQLTAHNASVSAQTST